MANALGLEIISTLSAIYEENSERYMQDPGDEKAFSKMMRVEPRIEKWAGNLAISSTGLAKIGSLALKAKKQKQGMGELLD